MESPNWSSDYAKYLLVLGTLLFVVGLDPFTRYGDKTFFTDAVKAGPEIIAQFTAVQILLVAGGVGLAAYGLYYERALS